MKNAKISVSTYSRHSSNPFRIGSNYSLLYDVFASHKDGISREELIVEYMKVSGKDRQHAYWDVAIILSPNHRCSHRCYGVEREADHFTLVVPSKNEAAA